jgi:hypothetical protein
MFCLGYTGIRYCRAKPDRKGVVVAGAVSCTGILLLATALATRTVLICNLIPCKNNIESANFSRDLKMSYTEIHKHGEIRRIPAGTIMLRKGQSIRSAMLILEGIVKIYQEDDEGNEFFMYDIEPRGSLFGFNAVHIPAGK